MSKRLIDLDIAKGICIFLVVLGHYTPDNTPSWYYTLLDVGYRFKMPFFMYASGFIYYLSKKPVTYGAFVWKKFKHLAIPYFLVSWLIIGIKLLTDGTMHVQNPVTTFSFFEVLYIPSAGIFLWFIYVLFFIFLIIPFFNTPRKINILLVLSLVWLVIPIQTTSLFCISRFKTYFFYFVLGCFCSQYQHIIREKMGNKNVFIPVLCFAMLYVLAQLAIKQSMPVIVTCLYVCLALTGIWVTIKISQMIMRTQKLKQIFLTLAAYSYTIYLFHTTFEGFVKSFLIQYPLTVWFDNHTSFFLMILSTVSVGVVGPILLHIFYKRIKNVLKIK